MAEGRMNLVRPDANRLNGIICLNVDGTGRNRMELDEADGTDEANGTNRTECNWNVLDETAWSRTSQIELDVPDRTGCN
ncbi:hypothetical protein NSS64_00665 [Paenibacillus sp. FSL H8-0122]|uniref:hypothetical protein n=1 Tax=Paenibacillus sp. FSL H8-0122 TaxID=2954510 RepID=UPI0030F7596A